MDKEMVGDEHGQGDGQGSGDGAMVSRVLRAW